VRSGSGPQCTPGGPTDDGTDQEGQTMTRRRLITRTLDSMRTVPRAQTLLASERISAVTHLLSSLEHLVTPEDRRKGGFNNWDIARQNFPIRSRRLRRAADIAADDRVTTALHGLRVAAAASLILPLPRDRFFPRHRRLAANAFLAGTSLALHPRHHYGTDGSDQGSFLVQSAAAAARANGGTPKAVDAALWYVSLQSVLSYGVSGLVKMTSPTWRSGDALAGVMRTRSYGDKATWEFLDQHPRVGKALVRSTLALETLFPLVFLGRKRVGPAFVAAAAGFHLANARLMGLGRFVWSFGGMHPAILYTIGPRERQGPGGTERRDDTLPVVAAGMAVTALTAGVAAQARRRRVVQRGRPGDRSMTTSSGNTLTYRISGPGPHESDDRCPIVVFESGLATSAEHWTWIVDALVPELTVVTYHRAGYASSTYRQGPGFTLDHAARDLVDLVDHVAGDRPVVLAGHSLGGYLALRAAPRMPTIRGVALLDSSHPGELQRSSQQAEGQRILGDSLDLMPASLAAGLGPLLDRPDWLDQLPEEVRPLALAQYRDTHMWAAARREWRAVEADFDAYDGRLPPIEVPVLSITAGQTALLDPVQQELHAELAALAPRAESHVVDGADHQQLLVDRSAAQRVARLVAGFVTNLDAAGRPGPTAATEPAPGPQGVTR
jgi:pimeloyl-ACP methyl ester carboxylesterase